MNFFNDPLGFAANAANAWMHNQFVQPFNNFGNQVNGNLAASSPSYFQQQAISDAIGNMQEQLENGKKMAAATSTFQIAMGAEQAKEGAARKAADLMRV